MTQTEAIGATRGRPSACDLPRSVQQIGHVPDHQRHKGYPSRPRPAFSISTTSSVRATDWLPSGVVLEHVATGVYTVSVSEIRKAEDATQGTIQQLREHLRLDETHIPDDVSCHYPCGEHILLKIQTGSLSCSSTTPAMGQGAGRIYDGLGSSPCRPRCYRDCLVRGKSPKPLNNYGLGELISHLKGCICCYPHTSPASARRSTTAT